MQSLPPLDLARKQLNSKPVLFDELEEERDRYRKQGLYKVSHNCIATDAQIRLCTQKHMHTLMHEAHACASTQTYAHAHTHTHTHAQSFTRTHNAHTQHTHTHTHAQHTRTRKCMHTDSSTYKTVHSQTFGSPHTTFKPLSFLLE
jgi:hypothetical protein